MKAIQKTGTNFDLTGDCSIKKYLTILMKFKNLIFQLILEILLQQQSLN